MKSVRLCQGKNMEIKPERCKVTLSAPPSPDAGQLLQGACPHKANFKKTTIKKSEVCSDPAPPLELPVRDAAPPCRPPQERQGQGAQTLSPPLRPSQKRGSLPGCAGSTRSISPASDRFPYGAPRRGGELQACLLVWCSRLGTTASQKCRRRKQ